MLCNHILTKENIELLSSTHGPLYVPDKFISRELASRLRAKSLIQIRLASSSLCLPDYIPSSSNDVVGKYISQHSANDFHESWLKNLENESYLKIIYSPELIEFENEWYSLQFI